MRYWGNGFSLEIPDGWVDRTIFTFVEMPDSGSASWVRIMLDEASRAGSARELADAAVRASLEAIPSSRLLSSTSCTMADGTPVVRTEIRWSAAGKVKLYLRNWHVLWGTTAAVALSQFERKGRVTQSPAVERIVTSMRPRGKSAPSGTGGGETNRISMNRFHIDLPVDWQDETVYTLAEGRESGFRRSIVIVRRECRPLPEASEELMDREIAGIERTEAGFVLVERTTPTVRGSDRTELCVFRREGDGGSAIVQAVRLQLREGILYVVTVTFEEAAPAGIRARLLESRDSFLVESAVSAGGSEPSTLPS